MMLWAKQYFATHIIMMLWSKLYFVTHITMMLWAKGILSLNDIHELLRCKAARAILKHHYIGNFFLCIY